MWNLIVSVPDHCSSFYSVITVGHLPRNSLYVFRSYRPYFVLTGPG